MTDELTYPRVFDEYGFSIDIVPSTGFFQSYDHEGRPLIYSSTLEECFVWTKRMLSASQDGGWSETRTLNDGTVGGKL